MEATSAGCIGDPREIVVLMSRAEALDLCIMLSTAPWMSPAIRPSMDQLARQLRAILAPELTPVEPADATGEEGAT